MGLGLLLLEFIVRDSVSVPLHSGCGVTAASSPSPCVGHSSGPSIMHSLKIIFLALELCI